MKEYEVKMVFDLTKPEDSNLYNSIRSLDGIKNAIANFRKKLGEIKSEYEFPSEKEGIEVIENFFIDSFKEQGINV